MVTWWGGSRRAPVIIYSTPVYEWWMVQSAGILDHNKDAALCSGNRVVQQASLTLDGASDMVRPQDDDRVELAIFRLMDGHRPNPAALHPAIRSRSLVDARRASQRIHRRLPNTHLVMHGSSSVPQELQDLFNAFGGNIRQTWGVPVEEIQRGIRHGVRKINVDTDNRLAMTGAVRKVLARIAFRVRSA